MPALSLRSGKAIAVAALLASVLGILLVAPVALAGQSPEEEQYCGFGGCDEEPGSNSGNGSSGPGGGGSPSSGGGSSGGGATLGPDASVVEPGSGSGSGSGVDSSSGSDSGSTASGSSDGGSNDSSSGAEESDELDGQSVGQVLSGGTDEVATGKPAASTDAGTRAAQAVSDDGGSGLLWLLLALGAVTAVAAGGVAVRRRQARQGYMN